MKELRITESFSQKWRRRRLALACLIIAFCFLLGDDAYRAKAIVFNNKDLFEGKKKVVNYLDINRKRIFQTDLRQKFWVNPNRKMQRPLYKALLAGGNTCGASATVIPSLPYNDAAGTTIGKLDDYDLPADTTTPTLTGCPTCTATGGGPAGSLPRGAVYTGTGTGADAAYSICFTSANNSINVTMDPTGAEDLTVMVYTNVCSNNLADGIVINDTGVGGQAETVTISTMPAGTYNIVVDGYSSGGTPPGPSGPYTLAVTGTGTVCPAVAAGVNIGGRIANSNGIGISGARVSMIKPSGEVVITKTNAFGYYKFEDLEVGLTYTVQVVDKRHQFANPTQIVTLEDAVEDLDFTALP